MSGLFSSATAAVNAFAARLASAAGDTFGAALVAYDSAVAYAVGTVGRALNIGQPKANVWTYLSNAQLANLTLAVPTIAADDALDAAWAAVAATGGVLTIPPGNYLLTRPWVCARPAAPRIIRIEAAGATFFSSAALAGQLVRITGGFNQYPVDVFGLSFNVINNATQLGCFDVVGSPATRILNCHAEVQGANAAWAFATFRSGVAGAGEDDKNCFWSMVADCSTRRRDGTSPIANAGIVLIGAVNAFTSTRNTWSELQVAIKAMPAPTTKSLPNSVTVFDDRFEACSVAGVQVNGTAGVLGPTGWRLLSNRVETTPYLLDIQAGGAMLPHSQPPILRDNYVTAGSVTGFVRNPTGLPVAILETRQPGFGPAVENVWYMAGGLRLAFTDGGGLSLTDASGNNSYSTAWVRFGAATVWYSNGTSKLKLSATPPAGDGSGVVIGPP